SLSFWLSANGPDSCRIDAPVPAGTAPISARFLKQGAFALFAKLEEQENEMKRFALLAGTVLLVSGISAMPASAACNGDASTETVLGAGSGAAVGGLASHSLGGAVVGGVAGGVIGNAIGHSNNRNDCRREAYREDRERYRDRGGEYRGHD